MTDDEQQHESQPLLPPSAELMPASRSKLQARRYISTSPEVSSSSLPGTSPPIMSDKAKGKQRAEPEPVREPHEHGCGVTVIFSNEESAGGNLDVWVEDKESVASVKDKIRTLRPNVAENQLRLIHAGRLLTDGVLLVPWLRSLDERVRRQAGGMGSEVSDVIREVGRELAGEGDEERPPTPQPTKRKVYLHCNVGGPLGAAPTPSDDVEPEAQPRRRGFDALLDAGLSAEEVAAMRRQFYASRGEEVPDLGTEGASDEHARALEEQWIEGDLTPATATMSSEGMYTSILHGLLAGFLFNVLPWFFFHDVPLPNFHDVPLPNFFDAEAEANEVARRESQAAEASERAAHALAVGGEVATVPSVDNSVTVSAAVSSPFVATEEVPGAVFSERLKVGVILGALINIGLGALATLFVA